MDQTEIDQFTVTPDTALKQALKRMNETAEKILFIVDEDQKLLGVVTDGDIREWIVEVGELSGTIRDFYNEDPVVVNPDYDESYVKEKMLDMNISAIPVINQRNEIEDILFWEDIFRENDGIEYAQLDVPVVIMAGGKGTRLDPFTRVLPKPLIPVGDKSVVEHIMERFLKFDIDEFYLTVHYMARTIKAYFDEVRAPYEIHFFEEESPLGTAGPLKQLTDDISGDFFVSNCDILIDCDYGDLLSFHRENNYPLTLVASVRHYEIPYGICEMENGGDLEKINEKPEYDFLVNTGFYVINDQILSLIPEDSSFQITELIQEIKRNDQRVGVYPVNEGSWLDVGEWDKYENTIKETAGDSFVLTD